MNAPRHVIPRPTPPKKRLAVYIDGANLYWGLHEASKTSLLWLDVVELARSLRPRSSLVKVRYFTTIVDGEPGAQSRQGHYISALEAKNPRILSVHRGRYQKKKISCHKCGCSWDRREEKETDVNIAVSLVADAARNEMDDALILSADSDLAPAARTAMSVNPRLFVAAAFPPKRASEELKSLMGASFHINLPRIRKAQLPEEFEVNGKTFKRPTKWE